MPRRMIKSDPEMAVSRPDSLKDLTNSPSSKQQLSPAEVKMEASDKTPNGECNQKSEKNDAAKGGGDKLIVPTQDSKKDDHGADDCKSTVTSVSVKTDEDDAGDSKKVLTEEEIAEKRKKHFESCEKKMIVMSTIPPRHLDQEGAPFTKEFRECLLTIAKSYFHFKLGRIPYRIIAEHQKDLSKAMCKHGTVKIILDVLTDSLKCKDYMDENGKMVNEYWFPVKNILLALLNYSDCSNDIRSAISDHPEVIQCMVDLLNEWQKPHLEKELSENRDKIIKWSLSILHNCGAAEENVPRLRDLGIIKTALPYLESHMDTIRLTSIAVLADLVNEEEAELLGAHVKIFKFIIRKLGKAMTTENHKDLGWSAAELTRAVGRLARNDANKKVLVNEGCLPLLVNLMKIGDEEETEEAIDTLWNLSFDEENKQKMVDEESLVEIVHEKYRTTSGPSRHACHGILWSLRDELCKSPEHKKIGDEIANLKSKASPKTEVAAAEQETAKSQGTTHYEGHVMISYQWANQEVIKKIVQELRGHGVPVWIDIDYMGGSTLQAMAKAVEDSFIVIIAMSQKYKDSPNTRAEAEYAFQQRKKIIPLIMQKGYRPDGWLGLILGSKLFYDFSGKYSFESRMDGLLRAVFALVKGGPGASHEQPVVPSKVDLQTAAPMVLTPSTPVSHQPPHGAKQVPQVDEEAVKKWTQEDITKWLTKYSLQQSSLSKLSGEEIVFMHNLRYEAPEFFYRCLESKLQVTSLLDLAHATKAFSNLTT